MREWILAMLVISAFLLIRDMAKIFSSGRQTVQVETIYDNHPQKKKMRQYAESFEKLSDSFYKMSEASDLHQIAMAEQMEELSHIMRNMAEEFYSITPLEDSVYDKLFRMFRKNRMVLLQAWKIVYPNGSEQYALNLKTKGHYCIPVKEAAYLLNKITGKNFVQVPESRSILHEKECVVRFMEDVNFRVMYGVAKVSKDSSTISGDNYGCMAEREGEFVLCLADGMGSGTLANNESEKVVDLFEQFLDSGFSKETAARMINSAMLLQKNGDMYSTVDVCTVNLYTGVCEFLKAGASTTFIKREDWIETITSTSLAVGLLQETDYEVLSKKLYPGDFLIMVTDGVLDALPIGQEEELMKEIIMTTRKRNPREMARAILERVLYLNENRAQDDMTVLVAGMWNK